MRKLLNNESGQAVVEYVLILAMVVSVTTAMAIGFRKSLFAFWTLLTKEVSAACPGCPADPSIR
jgi:Flp pilus assembly pilin Flp